MTVSVAETAGFCYGVRRAVERSEDAARSGKPCFMLGPVIHNPSVIRHLEELGVKLVERPENVPPGSAAILRSHGEGEQVHLLLSQRGVEVVDTTCPNVSRIHRLVHQAEQEGRTVFLIGQPDHPEVRAVAGWCQNAKIFADGNSLSNYFHTHHELANSPITMVAQTTLTQAEWNFCKESAKKQCTNIKIFDTICHATCARQTEAQRMAAESDAVVVIGGRDSANTRRLYELCLALCPETYWIEGPDELDPAKLKGRGRVAITAGASTPVWIIKEVIHKMSEERMEIEESFAEMLEKSLDKTLHNGDKVRGVITEITPSEVCVDLGTKHAGYISVSELTDDPTVKVEDVVKVGDEIETVVVRVNDGEGVVMLSKKRLDNVRNWDDVERAREERTTLEGTVTEENKGGVVVNVKGVRVFVPASQTGVPRDTPLTGLVKTKVKLRITEVNRARKRVVGSIRAVAAAERAERANQVWSNIEQGKRYHGVVKSLTSYGAFVDIGGVDGMVHISELSWSRIKHPSEVVNPGDEVEVYVISFDAEKRKISLGMKDPNENPWETFTGKYQPGDIANVRVVKLMTFGAFAEIVPGVDGLIHISQLSDHRVDKPSDVVHEGDHVNVKVTEIDYEHKKVSLSIRDAMGVVSASASEDGADTATADANEETAPEE